MSAAVDARELWLELVDTVAALPQRPACQRAPEAWFDPAQVDAVRAACAQCPVVDLCREYATAAGERFGVWGGLTSAERGTGRGV